MAAEQLLRMLFQRVSLKGGSLCSASLAGSFPPAAAMQWKRTKVLAFARAAR